MKKWMFALLLAIYLLQASVYYLYKIDNGIFFVMAVVFAISAIILAIVNIIKAILSMKGLDDSMEKVSAVNNAILMFKLLSIPFFVINFSIWALVTSAFLVVPGLQILLFIVPTGVGFSYLALLASSSYAIATLVKLYRSGKITNKQTIKHIILQLIFVADTIDYLILYNRIRKICKPPEAEEKILH